MSKEKQSQTHPVEPQRKRPRKPLMDAASVSDKVVLNIEDGSAGLRRQYPLLESEKKEKIASENVKAASVQSASESENGLTDVPQHLEEEDLDKELLKAVGSVFLRTWKSVGGVRNTAPKQCPEQLVSRVV